MACGPRRGCGGVGSGRAWTQPESWLRTGKEKALTGGAHVAEKEGGGEWGASWAGEGELGRRWDFWAAGKKEKRRGRKERWAGWAEKRKGVKERLFHF